ncbi:pyocin knob domain-containing protein [Alteromonas sp. DY56-G5]|uniref:pyocin knob domain-containing protein n=1 Tax=Alteromonas sp. DY56-G5 TaxID=2967128 RepID=UPI00352BB833
MTATFWTGSSLSFTNGSKTVTVNTGPSLDSVKANSSLTAGNYNEPVEVKSVSGNTITLYNNWPGSTGTTSATIKPSAAAAASAGVAAQQLITEIQSLVGGASATATANSFVKRDSNGRIKSASPSANDDVVTKGFTGSAATRNVGENSSNVMEVGAFGLGLSATIANNFDEINATGFYRNSSGSAVGIPFTGSLFNVQNIKASENAATQIAIESFNQTPAERMFIRSKESGGTWQNWVEIYHSGNINLNTLKGGNNGDVLAHGVASSENLVRFYIPLNSQFDATSITAVGTFTLKVNGNVNVSENVTGAQLSLRPYGSNRLAILEYSTSGLTRGQFAELVTNSASNSITFNF